MKQDKITYNHWKIVNIYIVYEISKSINISDYQSLENCLSGAVGLTKNADIDKYGYSGYGIGFDRHRIFSFPGIGLDKNAIIFGVDLVHQQRLIIEKDIFWFWVKIQQKDWNIHWVRKKCVRLILNTTIKNYVYIFIIMEQTVIFLLIAKKFLN